MVSYDDKLANHVRKIIEKYPRLKFMLPHLPIYVGCAIVAVGFTLHHVLNPIPDYDKPQNAEDKCETNTGFRYILRGT